MGGKDPGDDSGGGGGRSTPAIAFNKRIMGASPRAVCQSEEDGKGKWEGSRVSHSVPCDIRRPSQTLWREETRGGVDKTFSQMTIKICITLGFCFYSSLTCCLIIKNSLLVDLSSSSSSSSPWLLPKKRGECPGKTRRETHAHEHTSHTPRHVCIGWACLLLFLPSLFFPPPPIPLISKSKCRNGLRCAHAVWQSQPLLLLLLFLCVLVFCHLLRTETSPIYALLPIVSLYLLSCLPSHLL